ncbi:MAG: AAA family ATPase [Trichlorobacter sp.]|nr:AAA family ATPase [Trichlorobacter sp.]
MKIKRLEISGFKSFADRVTLDFQQGITGVVGPNGCGKSIVFAFYPGQLVALFAGSGAEAAEIIKIGIITMRFVAFYCLFDAANVVISSILAAVGETSWLARTFFICTCVFMVLLWGVDLFMPDLILEWALATAFVFITAVLWFFRFKKGVWRQQQVLRQS